MSLVLRSIVRATITATLFLFALIRLCTHTSTNRSSHSIDVGKWQLFTFHSPSHTFILTQTNQRQNKKRRNNNTSKTCLIWWNKRNWNSIRQAKKNKQFHIYTTNTHWHIEATKRQNHKHTRQKMEKKNKNKIGQEQQAMSIIEWRRNSGRRKWQKRQKLVQL